MVRKAFLTRWHCFWRDFVFNFKFNCSKNANFGILRKRKDVWCTENYRFILSQMISNEIRSSDISILTTLTET